MWTLDNAIEIVTIGKGTFGQVYCVKLPEKTVACKTLPHNKHIYPSILAELAVFSQVKSNDIIDFYGVEMRSECTRIFMKLFSTNLVKWCQKTSFDQRIESLPHLINDISTGLQHLHEAGFIHNDLAPSNILVRRNKFKIADFGLSGPKLRLLKADNTLGGTYIIRAPEVLLPLNVDRLETLNMEALDVWALGICCLYMIKNSYPVLGNTLEELLEDIRIQVKYHGDLSKFKEAVERRTIRGHLPVPDIDPLSRQIVTVMCSLNPDERPTLSKVINKYEHPIPKEDVLARLKTLTCGETLLLSYEMALRYPKTLDDDVLKCLVYLAKSFLLKEVVPEPGKLCEEVLTDLDYTVFHPSLSQVPKLPWYHFKGPQPDQWWARGYYEDFVYQPTVFEHRKETLQWFLEIVENNQISLEVWYQTVDYLEQYLSKYPHETELELYTIASLSLCIDITVDSLCKLCHGKYTTDDMWKARHVLWYTVVDRPTLYQYTYIFDTTSAALQLMNEVVMKGEISGISAVKLINYMLDAPTYHDLRALCC